MSKPDYKNWMPKGMIWSFAAATIVALALTLIVSIGVALCFGNLWLLVLPFIFWALMAIMLKPTEEKWLRNLYGTEYDAYCKRVNRTWPWFPKQY